MLKSPDSNPSELLAAHRVAQPSRIPKTLARYFWDCDTAAIDMRVHCIYVAERILRYGNPAAVRWLLRHVHTTTLHNVVDNSKNLDNKTRAYWRVMLHHED